MSLLHTHLVFVTKYRRTALNDAMLTHGEPTMRDICAGPVPSWCEFNGEADHVHLLAAYLPTLAISTPVNRLNGVSASELRYQFTGRTKQARMNGHLWSPSYFAVSCGAAPRPIIKQYIEQQNRPT